MLVRQRFYARFARHACERGYRVVTFDHRGLGESLKAEQGAWEHRIEHWGQLDLPAVIGAFDGRRVLVGHSMGGQIPTLAQNVAQLSRIVTVAATAAFWRHWPRPDRYGILAWYGLVPLLGRGLPVLPTERLGLGPDLDTRLLRGWAKWGRDPAYLDGFGLRHHPYEGPVLSWSFADDRLGARRAVEVLHRRYPRLEHRVAERGGHFGFFRDPALWSETLGWIQAEEAAGVVPGLPGDEL